MRTATISPAAAVLVIALAGSWAPASSGAEPASPGARRQDAPAFVFASGLDHGPIGDSSPGMHQTDGPGTSLEWQGRVRRTGAGAYHAVGGDLRGDETIGNQASSLPFGGLEVWVGAAFRFVSFPDADAGIWLMATVPTDGVAGADDKPVVTIGSSGRLRLAGSNSPDAFVETSTRLSENRWYSLVLHGRNGVAQTQQLFVYNGRTDRLIERLDLVMDVTGTFVNRLTKWGFGTSQDSGGLEYYLDDLFHARGGSNPGPVRVFPRTAIGSRGSGFVAVGAPTNDEAVDDVAPDADATYIANAGDEASAAFRLASLPPARGARVYLIQVTAIARSAGSGSSTARIGLKTGSRRFTSAAPLGEGYAPHAVAWAENPSTGRSWRMRDRFSGVVEDADGVADGMRITAVWWDVVYVS